MYTLAVRREFIARHYLVGGDWGPENQPNSHRYLLELRLIGDNLDQHGFLCDIVDVEQQLGAVVGGFRDQMLNDRPEFQGLNPSIEHFARILAESLSTRILANNISAIEVVLWEDDNAWASYKLER